MSMTSAIYACWSVGIAIQIVAAIWLLWRMFYWLPAAALLADSAKSIYLWTVPQQEYEAAWQAVRPIHWMALATLAIYAIWLMARWWPQAWILFSSAVAGIGSAAVLTAAAQWGVWVVPGKAGGAIAAGRAVGVAALAFLGWGMALCERLSRGGKMPRNAGIFARGLLWMIAGEVAGVAIATASKSHLNGWPAFYVIGVGQILNALSPIAFVSWLWLSQDGDRSTLPPADPDAGEKWDRIAELVRRERDRARRKAAGAM